MSSGSHLSKELLDLVKSIGESRSKQEEDKDKGFGLRGSIYLRAPGNTDKCFVLAATFEINNYDQLTEFWKSSIFRSKKQ